VNKGLSLLEVLIAIGLIATVILAAAQLQSTGLKAARSASLTRSATSLANQQLEQMRSDFSRLSEGNGGCPLSSEGFQVTCSVDLISEVDTAGNLAQGSASSAIGARVRVKVEREGRTFLELNTLIAK
jgi:prepilin-type N-terminal cleavage/methylation domain-containing protein